ncbi:MAG: OmpA family protein [Bacteroidia bacterium]|nr:MAG: OmpA family protein [Bacteroidia bacterium]
MICKIYFGRCNIFSYLIWLILTGNQLTKSADMKTLIALIILLGPISTLISQDIEGAKDHPLLSRIAGFSIFDYSVQNFAGYQFCDEQGKNITVEGMVSYYYYECDCDIDPKKIINTLGGAITTLGGKVYGEGPNQRWMVLSADNKITWIDLYAEDFYYTLNIIEKGEIISEITAESFLAELESKGKAIIYLNFDRDMCVIKEECKPVIKMISDALKASPELKVSIECHTDDIGRSDDNILLSTNRAVSFATALVGEGVDASRIETKGLGEVSPVATNETVEGRALNNRLEIIKK